MLNWARPLDMGNSGLLIEQGNSFKVLMTYGIFENVDDINQEKVWGDVRLDQWHLIQIDLIENDTKDET